jgi:hypothetical protein
MDCCTMDECIAPYGIHYMGGGTPPRAGGQEGGGQGRRLQWRRHLGEAAPPETLMGCLPCNPNGPAPGEAAYRGGGNPNGPIQHSLTVLKMSPRREDTGKP